MNFQKFLNAACLLGFLAFITAAQAEDTDIFNQPAALNQAPNVLFILDNTSNWSNNSQFPSGSQGDAELQAISNIVNSFTSPVNIGLMMFTDGAITGGYLRYGIRPISNQNNKSALTSLLSGINPGANAEKINKSVTPIVNSLYETWLYLNGSNSYAGMDLLADYSGNTANATTASYNLTTGFAYQGSSTGSSYNSPLGINCAKTYIIYVGNNNPAAKIDSISGPALSTLQQYNYTTLPSAQAAWARFLHLRPDLPRGTAASSIGSVTTYTLDVYGTNNSTAYTQVLKDMAQNGGGQYFQASDKATIATSLSNIFNQIQSVNSAFASASLPVSVSVRGTYLNQVYLGVFRPDAMAKPNWTGNMKEYQLGVDTTTTPASLFLADSLGARAENLITGFVNPSVISFWTKLSNFWDPTYYANSQGVGGVSDSPDGDLVEKGGAAEALRFAYATDLTNRNVYTCTGTCGTGSALSNTPFSTANAAITDTLLTTNSTIPSDRSSLINWVRGANTQNDDNPEQVTATAMNDIRGFAHGDVLHSRPAVINYDPTAGADKTYVFYGSNDGMLHAVKGGTASGGGVEQWTFITPEHFPKFKRMRDHTPLITASAPKPYFVDGSTTTYTQTNSSGVVTKAYLFVTMRRGGRMMYALDVTDPVNPKFLWKHSNLDAGFSELGDSWSDMTVAKLKLQSGPVLIFGLGYDAAANDPSSQTPATMGRGVMVLNAADGALLWQAGPANGMNFAIPASITTFDSNNDGYVDRLYAVDTGANVWRINVNDPSTANWTVSKLASLSGVGSANARKFLFAPDAVAAAPGGQYDSVLVGSGDREHPFDTTVVNRYYMIKDAHTIDAVPTTPIIEGVAGSTIGVAGTLYDTTLNYIQAGTSAQMAAATTALATSSGWYITLGSGEKVVSGSTTLAGSVIFGTNTPTAATTNTCTANLGEGRLYILNYLNGAATVDVNQNGTIQTMDRFEVRAGGGYPPTPVPVSVKIGGNIYQAAISGTKVITPPAPALGRRYRTYWQRLIDR